MPEQAQRDDRLARLSFDGDQPFKLVDGEPPVDILTQVAALRWDAITPGGGKRGLELLSLDRTTRTGLSLMNSFGDWFGYIYIAEAGEYTFSVVGADPGEEMWVGFPDPVPHDLLELALAWAVRDLVNWVDGRRPRSWSATVHVDPALELPVTPWPVHPGCGCSWGARVAG